MKANLTEFVKQRMPYPWEDNQRAIDWEYVYLITDEKFERFKIGRSKDVYQRFLNLRTASGVNLYMVIFIEFAPECDASSKVVEKLLHEYFKEKRKIGEWFDLDLRDVLQIRHLFWEYIFGENIEDNMPELWEIYKKTA